MADSKITALTAISTVDPTADPLVIVDVSDTSMAASGTTKKSTINQLLGSGGTATLASATITGDLTVDTNTLKVDSANNRVGIGTASPAYPLHVSAGDSEIVIQDSNTPVGSNPASLLSFWGSASRAGYIGYPSDNNLYINQVANNSILFLTNNTTQMTLNATGLGVGVAPTQPLTVRGSVAAIGMFHSTNANGPYIIFQNSTGNFGDIGSELAITGGGSADNLTLNSRSTSNLCFAISDSVKMRLDASGNLLVGTTSVSSAFNTKFHISSDSGTTKWAVGPYSSASNFVISAAGGGGVYLNGTAATSWTSASDERLKDIIEPISNAIAKVGSLRAVIGKFKFDQNNTRKPFLIAQDIQAVLPEAVDASNPDQLGVAYTEVIPLLVAAIKELTARVQTLETR